MKFCHTPTPAVCVRREPYFESGVQGGIRLKQPALEPGAILLRVRVWAVGQVGIVHRAHISPCPALRQVRCAFLNTRPFCCGNVQTSAPRALVPPALESGVYVCRGCVSLSRSFRATMRSRQYLLHLQFLVVPSVQPRFYVGPNHLERVGIGRDVGELRKGVSGWGGVGW